MSARAMQMITVLGRRVRVDVQPGTRPDLPPLLLLMGLGGSIETWEPFRSCLADRTGGTTVAVDVPGTGGSPAPRLPFPLVLHALLIERVADALRLGTFDLLGLSWGGLLAQQVALTAPRRVWRLVLANTNFGFGSVPGRGLAHSPARGRPPSWRGSAHQILALTGWSSLPVLPLIRQPTLVLNGDDDPAVPVVNSRVLARLLPDARLAVVPGGSHFMLFDRTEETAATVADFLTAPPAADT